MFFGLGHFFFSFTTLNFTTDNSIVKLNDVEEKKGSSKASNLMGSVFSKGN
jgi:hypothetical protein